MYTDTTGADAISGVDAAVAEAGSGLEAAAAITSVTVVNEKNLKILKKNLIAIIENYE